MCGTRNAVTSDMTRHHLHSLKGRFLTAIGYVCARHESASDAFDRLRIENPDLFPVPRAWESFWDAIAEVAGETTHTINIGAMADLKADGYASAAMTTLECAHKLEERAFRFVEQLTGSAADVGAF